ncbi:MAG: hypothetical protein BWY71_00532 [Planctomycetes bacterium ADurb.Bin412]|nr:MAG: hypothetical protein BWY71_00532 [Planctomycetes bacterium ADurb.Bin412]
MFGVGVAVVLLFLLPLPLRRHQGVCIGLPHLLQHSRCRFRQISGFKPGKFVPDRLHAVKVPLLNGRLLHALQHILITPCSGLDRSLIFRLNLAHTLGIPVTRSLKFRHLSKDR